MPLVSVIVPNYNHSNFLRKRLDSILNQTFRNFELIILDDASTDNSREIILEYAKRNPAIITCYNEKNSGGPFKQWNKGVDLSSGEYLWIAESDDYSDPDFLKKTVAEMIKSVKTGLVFCDTWIRDEEKRIKYLRSDKIKSPGINQKYLTLHSFVRNPIPNVSCVLFRKSAFLDAGKADESMKYCGDWYIYLKIFKTCDIVYIPEPLSTFRLHDKSMYHHQYNGNRFLCEKLIVSKYLIRVSDFSASMIIKVLNNILLMVILKILHILNLPGFLMPEIPRTPAKVKSF